MDKYTEKVNDVELIETTEYYTEFVEGFKKIRTWAENENLKDEVKLAQYEIEICSFCERNPILSNNKYEKRFAAVATFADGTEWPDIRKFSDNQFEYYEKRLDETNNVFLKARYSDFLFEYGDKKTTKNKYEISKYLLSSLVEISEHYREGYNYTSSVARLVEVSFLMKNRENLKKAVELIYQQINGYDKCKDYKWFYDLSKLIREILDSEHKEMISESNSNKIINVLEKVTKKYFEDKNYDLHRRFCKELIRYSKLNLITLEKKNELQINVGKSFELEAEYQQGRKNKSLLVKALFLENAMEHYKEIGEREKFKEMKILIKRTYEEYEKSSEMSLIRIPYKIPKEKIDKYVEYFTSSDIQDSLDKIANSNCFIPEVKAVEEQVKKLSEDYPLQDLVQKSFLRDGKKIETTTTKDTHKEFNFNHNYLIYININTELLLKAIFDKLITVYGISVEDFMKKLNRWELLDNKNVPFIKQGISRFLEKDYMSAIHILVPQFESTLRRMFSKAGYSTTSIKKGNTQQEVTFNEFLLRDDIKSELGNDVHKLIQIVMVEKSGLNLRNEIAHGLIDISDINYTKGILVIYLFLVLTSYTIKKSD